MNQIGMVIKYMERYGSITQNEASQYLGCTRLSARIADIKAQGHKVKTIMVHGKNRFGESVHYAKYSLEERENG